GIPAVSSTAGRTVDSGGASGRGRQGPADIRTRTGAIAMELVVDLAAAKVTLRDAHDMGRFAVRALPAHPGAGEGTEALGALAAALSLAHAGRVNPAGEVSVAPDAVKRLAGDEAGATWEAA